MPGLHLKKVWKKQNRVLRNSHLVFEGELSRRPEHVLEIYE